MADNQREVIEIDECYSSPDEEGDTHLRQILCAKNRDQIKKFEKEEDCFILEFDPYDEIDIKKLSLSMGVDDAGVTDLCVVAEKGQVACRDYPHSRHSCAKYPFDKTPHETHCDLCYCYVCDSDAPCRKWVGSSGHCHAFKSETWDKEREERKCIKKNECYCYVCESPAPFRKWLCSSGHCHALNTK